ncbi:MAG: galactokinase [Bacilli bacterium]
MKKYFSPGRINLIGEHIDYNGGNVFPCAIDLGVTGMLDVNNSNYIRLHSKNINSRVITIDYMKKFVKTNTWADYMIGVLDVFRKHGYENEIGFDLEIDSTLPQGTGLSSSACIEVLMAVILNDLNNFGLSDKDISVYAKEAENNFVGVNCGIMDQFIIANGKKNHALLLNTDTLKFSPIKLELNEHTILIINSNKKRGLVDSIYNIRREECQKATDIAIKEFGVSNLCDIDVNQLEKIKGQMNENVYKRAYHAVHEQQRVTLAIKALKENNIKLFSKYVTKAHYSMKDYFEASCNELDFLVETALKLGALGARMIGAGFGGCAIAIIKNEDVNDFKYKIKERYKKEFNLDCFVHDVRIVEKCQLVKADD